MPKPWRTISSRSVFLFLALAALHVVLGKSALAASALKPLAGTWVVTTTNDSGAGSLRAMLEAAAPNDTIVFNLPANSTITLTSGELSITKALTIDGSTATHLAVSGNHTSRVFNLTAPATFIGFSVINGDATNSPQSNTGGGINSTSDLLLTNMLVMSNTAFGGGGLYTAQSLTANDTDFIGNRSYARGGGVYSVGAAGLNRGRFENNNAGGARGGGIYANDTLTITGTQFIGNQGVRGGGAYVFGSAVVNDGYFEHNRTFGDGGGGLYAARSLNMRDTQFISNTADLGGGAYVGGALVLDGGRFERNQAITGGGLHSASTLNISGTQFISNSATSEGGGLRANDAGTVTASLFQANRAATGGGGQSSGAVTFAASRFMRNEANLGGGFYQGSGDINLVNTLFAANTASVNGAALYLGTPNRAQLMHVTITSPTLVSSAAVAVVSGTVTISNSIIASHTVGISHTGGSVTQDFNLFFGNGVDTQGLIATGMNNVLGNPHFVNPASDNYRLGIGSVAVDTGTNLGITTDFEGKTRPQGAGYDIGFAEGNLLIGFAAIHSPAPMVRINSPTLFTASLTGGTGVTFQWDFGDNTPNASSATVAHTYTSLGVYTATVTATNDSGALTIVLPLKVVIPRCFADLGGPLEYMSDDASVLQYVVDGAASGSIVRIAGDCAGTQLYAGTAQTVYISKTLTLRGGYTPTHWTTSNPIANPTLLDAQHSGRVVYSTGADVTLENLTLQNGVHTARGGGVYADQALTLTNVHVLNNTAMDSGGGVFVGGKVMLTDDLFSGNHSEGAGGGLYVQTALFLTDTQFVSNTAQMDGAGAYANGSAVLVGGHIEDNHCLGASCNGGGLNIEGTATVEGVDFERNTAAHCGGLRVAQKATLSYTQFMTNTASGQGGALCTDQGGDDLGSLFQSNQATTGGGWWSAGGPSKRINLTNTRLTSNTAQSAGGGLYASEFVVLTGARLENNRATDGVGGGAFIDSYLWFKNTQFIGNLAKDDGGAVYQNNGYLLGFALLQNSLFARNEAGGAAIYLNAPSGVTIWHTTIASPTLVSGPAIVVDTGPDNSASIYNSIVASYTIGISQTVGDISEDHNLFFGSGIDIQSNPAWNVWHGGHALTGDPKFINPARDNYRLGFGSVAVDAGDDVGLTIDFEGEPRPMGAGFDIGYDEANFVTGLSVTHSPSPTVPINVAASFTVTVTAGTVMTYAWDFGDGTPVTNGDSLDHVYSGLGTYIVVVTATNSSGQVTATHPVTVVDEAITGLSVTHSPLPTALLGTTVSFTATTTAGTHVTYQWDFGDGTSPLMMSGETPTHTYASVGIFTVIVTATNGVGSVAATPLVTITAVPIVGLTVISDSPTPLGTGTAFTASVTAGSNVSYRWDYGDGTQLTGGATPTHTYTSIGVFMVTITATNGSGAVMTSIAVDVQDVAISGLSAASDGPTVLGHTTQFTGSTAAGTNTTYTWNFGDGTPIMVGASLGHVYALSGSYTAIVTATNSLGSVSVTTPVTITNAAPVADAGVDQSVSIDGVVVLAGVDSRDPDQHLPLAYHWVQTGGPLVTLSDSGAVSPSFTAPNRPAVLTFTLGVTDARGLPSDLTDEAVITVKDIGIAGLAASSSSPTRLMEATEFSASISMGSDVTYVWDFGDGSAAALGQSVSHIYAAARSYIAVVTATNGSGSVSASTVVQVINLPPIANAGLDQSVSVGAVVTITGDGSDDPDHHLPLIYQWQQTGGPAITLSHPTAASPTFIAPHQPTTLTFMLIVTDSQGWVSANDEVVITVQDEAVEGLILSADEHPGSAQTYVINRPITLTAAISTGSNVTYRWDFGDVTAASLRANGSISSRVTHTYSTAGNYNIKVTAVNGQGSVSQQILVVITPRQTYLPILIR